MPVNSKIKVILGNPILMNPILMVGRTNTAQALANVGGKTPKSVGRINTASTRDCKKIIYFFEKKQRCWSVLPSTSDSDSPLLLKLMVARSATQ